MERNNPLSARDIKNAVRVAENILKINLHPDNLLKQRAVFAHSNAISTGGLGANDINLHIWAIELIENDQMGGLGAWNPSPEYKEKINRLKNSEKPHQPSNEE